MRRALLATAAVIAVAALGYLVEARRYPWGTESQPGAGVYPTLVGALVLVSALGLGIESALRPPGRVVEWPSGPARRRVLAILLPTVGYVLLLPWLGHPLAATLLLLAVLNVMGMRKHWALKLAVAAAIGLASYYVFGVLLGVPLPRGAWLS
jgi:hypothetical protein